MKILILSFVFAGFVLSHYAPKFINQLDDYKKSSACIKQKINDGYARSDIIVIGDSCKIKGEQK
jgi:hypothetical protein